MTKMCHPDLRCRSNAIHLLSGDQLGVPENSGEFVNCTGLFPSASHTQIFIAPERFDWNTTRLPSGEYRAARSSRVEEAKVRGGFPGTSCQRSKSVRFWT